MGKVYIDVSSTVKVPFTTGIQRVTKNVVKELLKSMPDRLELIFWRDGEGTPCLLPHNLFEAYLSKEIEREELLQKVEKEKKWSVSHLGQGDAFLELDAGWGRFTPPRPWLYRKVKEKGAKLLVFVHDVIPVTYPQFCDGETVIWFLGYLGAVLSHADGIITSTQAVQDEITRIAKRLEISRPAGWVSGLGSDFCEKASFQDELDEDVPSSLEGKKFILSVGTIEPRKNQRLLLDAFEEGLFEKDVCLVLTGMGGCNTAKLQNKLQQSPYAGKQLFWFGRVGDSTLAWLYAHAYLVGVSTFEEGFCLPVTEALQQGAPVLAADIPVIREVGKDYCVYFAPNDDASFVEKVSELLEDEGKYQFIKKRAEKFEAFTWEDTAAKIAKAVEAIPCETENTVPAEKLTEEEEVYEEYRSGYARCHGLNPVFSVGRKNGELQFMLPEYGLFPATGKLCLKFDMNFPKGEDELNIHYQLLDRKASEEYPFGTSKWRELKTDCRAGFWKIELDGALPENKGMVIFKADYEGETCYGRLPLVLMSEDGDLSPLEIQAAYRYLLGRQPNQRELCRALYKHETPEALRAELLSVPEFQKACGQ